MIRRCSRRWLESTCQNRGLSPEECQAIITQDDGEMVLADFSKIPPSLAQKARNFAVSAAKHVATGMQRASDEEIIRRYEICTACEFFKENSCTKCGCPISRERKFISKLAWADQECPVGKWGNSK